jgi:hypothetical protein
VPRAAWSALVPLVGLVTLAWVAVFDGALHPRVAAARSLREFMVRVATVVPAGDGLHAVHPPDPGLRFYAARPLLRWPKEGTTTDVWAVFWADELPRLREQDGRPVAPALVSDATQPGRGPLALVRVPAGARLAPR